MNCIVACSAATQENARCRKSSSGGQFCIDHQRVQDDGHIVRQAPVPDVVLFKANINQNWVRRFEDLGVKEKERDILLEEARHTAHAEQFGRDAHRYRQVADSGVPVLGKDGGRNMSVSWVLQQLQESYNFMGLHFLSTREGKPDMRVLVGVFADRSRGDYSNSQLQLLKEFYRASFEHIHLWANPPKEDGTVVHTVNASHRQPEKKPEAELHFGNIPGNWYVTI